MFLERPFEKPSVLPASLEIEGLSGREGWLAPASRSLVSTLSFLLTVIRDHIDLHEYLDIAITRVRERLGHPPAVRSILRDSSLDCFAMRFAGVVLRGRLTSNSRDPQIH